MDDLLSMCDELVVADDRPMLEGWSRGKLTFPLNRKM